MQRLIPIVVSCVLLSGCFGRGEGVEVPLDQIYFPVGLALGKGSEQVSDKETVVANKYLFVVSSDFDLQYNGGAVQSYDLDELGRRLPRLCVADSDCDDGTTCQQGGMCAAEGASPCPQGDRAAADRLLAPGRCNPIDPRPLPNEPNPLQTASVKIGAFATDAIFRQRESKEPTATGRLYVPVRGDSTLHWIDFRGDGRLECGQESSADHACDAQHRAGDDPTQNDRGITLNAEPFAIDADEFGNTIAVTNQTTGTASLFVTSSWAEGPKLAFALSSDSIPARPVGIAAVPKPLTANQDEDDTFLMTFRNSAQVRLFRFAPDGSVDPPPEAGAGGAPSEDGAGGAPSEDGAGGAPSQPPTNHPRPFLVDGGGVAIDANSVGSDSRGIAIDPFARVAARARCGDDATCIQDAGLVPLDVYVANRAPASLLIGRTRPPQEYPYFFESVPLTAGPSRVVVGQVTTASGEQESRVFVACFDSRRIFVYDPQRSRIETEILTGRGPHAMAVDAKRKLLYVGHFTDSYVGVYSLDLAFPATYGTMLGSLGTPKAPRSSK